VTSQQQIEITIRIATLIAKISNAVGVNDAEVSRMILEESARDMSVTIARLREIGERRK